MIGNLSKLEKSKMVERKNNLPLSKLCKTRRGHELIQQQPLHAPPKDQNQFIQNTIWRRTNLPSTRFGSKISDWKHLEAREVGNGGEEVVVMCEERSEMILGKVEH